MKKLIALAVILVLIMGSALCDTTAINAQDAIAMLLAGNARYTSSDEENISQQRRSDTAANGQEPYAVIVTCSDSRVPAELVFDAGIGELFIIRTAGNVIGDYELGSIEYGAEHLHAPLVIVMGHTHCGAVDAALNGGAHGYIETITKEISEALPEGCDAAQAEILNVKNSIANIRTSHIMQEMEGSGAVTVMGAIYDIETGAITFLPEQ